MSFYEKVTDFLKRMLRDTPYRTFPICNRAPTLNLVHMSFSLEINFPLIKF